jgi:hypothetical protein
MGVLVFIAVARCLVSGGCFRDGFCNGGARTLYMSSAMLFLGVARVEGV